MGGVERQGWGTTWSEGSDEWGGSQDEYIRVPEAVDGLGQVLLVTQPRWCDTRPANGRGAVA